MRLNGAWIFQERGALPPCDPPGYLQQGNNLGDRNRQKSKDGLQGEGWTIVHLKHARRRGKEGAVGKKARVGASRPFQAIHGPLKRKSQKTVRQGNEEARTVVGHIKSVGN